MSYFDGRKTPVLRVVNDRISQYYDSESINPLLYSDDLGRAKASIARLVGASPEQIAFVPNVRTAADILSNKYRACKIIAESPYNHPDAQFHKYPDQEIKIIDDRKIVGVDAGGAQHHLTQTIAANVINIPGLSWETGESPLYHTYMYRVRDFYEKENLEQPIIICDASHMMTSRQLHVDLLPALDHALFSGSTMFGPEGIAVLFSRTGFDDIVLPEVSNAGVLGLGIAAEWLQFLEYSNLVRLMAQVHTWAVEHGLFNLPFTHIKRNVTSIQFLPIHTFSCNNYPFIDSEKIQAFLANRSVFINTLGNRLHISFGPYNTEEDIIALVDGLKAAVDCREM